MRCAAIEKCVDTVCDELRGFKEDEKDKKIINTVKKRKLGYFVYIIRYNKYELMQLIIKANIEDARNSGRRQTFCLKKNLRIDLK